MVHFLQPTWRPSPRNLGSPCITRLEARRFLHRVVLNRCGSPTCNFSTARFPIYFFRCSRRPQHCAKVRRTQEANFSIRTRPAKATTCCILLLSTSHSPSAALLRWIDLFIWKRATTSFPSSGLGNFCGKFSRQAPVAAFERAEDSLRGLRSSSSRRTPGPLRRVACFE
jgi:hypothetical protein